MKHTQRCPKCECSSLLFLREIADATAAFGAGVGAWMLARLPDGTTRGHVQALICRGCGFTELYVYDPDSIPVDGTVVTRVASPQTSPFR
ncbi:MAG: hypothetical protein KF718_24845 [Polyangiaceae bacterium]|nr:hypothetical protein [Polyangiaceae bacterium]